MAPEDRRDASAPEALHCSGIRDVLFGEDVTVVDPVNLYGCVIGDRSFIGPFVEIQAGVRVGGDCRIQSHSFICSGVTIGDRCFVGHGVMFVNDLFTDGHPARGDTSKYVSTHVEDDVSIGSNATVLGVRIAAGSVIGAGSVVTRDCTVAGVYAGNPARLLRSLGADTS